MSIFACPELGFPGLGAAWSLCRGVCAALGGADVPGKALLCPQRVSTAQQGTAACHTECVCPLALGACPSTHTPSGGSTFSLFPKIQPHPAPAIPWGRQREELSACPSAAPHEEVVNVYSLMPKSSLSVISHLRTSL